MPAEVFAKLPVLETVELVPEEVKAEPDAFEKIGEERTFEVEIIGPKLVKREFVRPKFRRKAEREAAPVIAPAVPRPAAGGYASAGLIAYVVVSKYQHHLPLYAGPGIKRPMPGDELCRVGAGGASTAVAQDPA
jgi:transposase